MQSLPRLHRQAVETRFPAALDRNPERLALDFAEAMTLNRVDDDLRRRLKQRLDDDAIVELTALIAFQNLRQIQRGTCGASSRVLPIIYSIAEIVVRHRSFAELDALRPQDNPIGEALISDGREPKRQCVPVRPARNASDRGGSA
jgi:hypothetical protein